jgi:signal transduction histidine kinase
VRPRLLTMSMPPHDGGPSLARRFVAHALTLVGLEEDEPDAALVVSELVSNACRFARDVITIRVELRAGDHLRIEIEDDGPGTPELTTISATDDEAVMGAAGRGLRIVAAIAREWGTRPTDNGKVVWVELGHHGMDRVSA